MLNTEQDIQVIVDNLVGVLAEHRATQRLLARLSGNSVYEIKQAMTQILLEFGIGVGELQKIFIDNKPRWHDPLSLVRIFCWWNDIVYIRMVSKHQEAALVMAEVEGLV